MASSDVANSDRTTGGEEPRAIDTIDTMLAMVTKTNQVRVLGALGIVASTEFTFNGLNLMGISTNR